MTEKRAQDAEERASAAELELAAALETVRSLQKQLEKMAGPSESSTSLSEKPLTTTPVAPSPSHAKESPRHHADGSKADTKKKDPRTKSSGKPKKKDKP